MLHRGPRPPVYQSGIYQLAVDTNVVLGSHLLSRLNLINFMSHKFFFFLFFFLKEKGEIYNEYNGYYVGSRCYNATQLHTFTMLYNVTIPHDSHMLIFWI